MKHCRINVLLFLIHLTLIFTAIRNGTCLITVMPTTLRCIIPMAASQQVYIRSTLTNLITLLLNKDDYYKIAPTNYQNLIDTRKKIHIKAEVRYLSSALTYCNKLLNIDTLDGETKINSKKLNITDYR